jgi:hypothetical protein
MAFGLPWIVDRVHPNWTPPSRRALLALYALAGIAAGILSLAFGQSKNFHVFCAAARALLRGEDLYVLRAGDYFKYSPTFALLFVPFTWLPTAVAAPLWSLFNFGAAFLGIDRVVEDARQKRVALSVALAGIVLTTDGDQSNLLVAGALLLAFDAFERGRPAAGATLVLLGTYTKIFPLIGAAFALLRPGRLRHFGAMLAAAIGGLVLPLTVTEPRTLTSHYVSWWRLLARDHANEGWSAMGMLREGLGLHASNGALQLAGVLLQVVPIALGLRFAPDAAWRRTLACSLLVWAVLFNHRAEYATYVVSAVAVAVWIASADATPVVYALVLTALVAPGPFFARPDPSVGGVWTFLAAHRLFHPLRVAPLFAVWLLMLRDLIGRFVSVRVSIRISPSAHAS